MRQSSQRAGRQAQQAALVDVGTFDRGAGRLQLRGNQAASAGRGDQADAQALPSASTGSASRPRCPSAAAHAPR
jgi:hypothetical protein